jgi:hypothetical protein
VTWLKVLGNIEQAGTPQEVSAWLIYALVSLRPSPWARCDFKVAETFWSSAILPSLGEDESRPSARRRGD